MKRIITLLLIAIFSINLSMAEDDEGGAKIVFETKKHDFGVIKEANGPVTCEFNFKNEGDEPLIIIYARASCGCTKPDYPRKPIAPGKSGVVKVTYDPKNRPGAFNKSVRVKTNDVYTYLTLVGTVIPKD